MGYPSVKPLCFDKSVALTTLIDPAQVTYSKPSAYTLQFPVGSDASHAPYKGHSGIDLATTENYPVLSLFDGKVTTVARNDSYGKYVVVTNGLVSASYFHFSSQSVSVGQQVKAGQEIGKEGRTGKCTGPHVHIMIKVDGKVADPYEYVLGLKPFPFTADEPAAPAPAPTTPGGTTYTVVSGDTLGKIAARFGTTVAAIMAANTGLIKDANMIMVGWKLAIPGSTANPASTAPKKSNEVIAREVIKGDWGNGQDRKDRLAAAGYDYVAVQAVVNKLMKG